MRTAYGQTLFLYEKDAYASHAAEGGKQWLALGLKLLDLRSTERALERFCNRLEHQCGRMEHALRRVEHNMDKSCRALDKKLNELDRRLDNLFA